MAKFLSGRQRNLNLGIRSFTENKTVLDTVGKVGIGTTDAEQYSLKVIGDTNIVGDLYTDDGGIKEALLTLSPASVDKLTKYFQYKNYSYKIK